MNFISQDLVWWISVFDLPAMAGLFALIWRTRRECDEAVTHVQSMLELRSDQFREALHAFKLEVAKTYASQRDLRALEGRLVAHLLRIETKLDKTALKTENLSGKQGD